MQKVNKLPNFFIVGAAKCGTSSLADYVGQHPSVYLPSIKEPFYFVSDIGFSNYDEYMLLFRNSGDVLAMGEASAGYLYDEQAAFTIKSKYPTAKIIIVLRNPVDMAFSLWRYIRITGKEPKSFEEAITDHERVYRKNEQFKKSCAGWWANYLYLERASYFNQVKRYFDIFGRDRVKVYIFERFIKEPEKVCQNIFEFLGVENDFVPDCAKVVNEGGEVRFRFLKCLRNRKYPLLAPLLPGQYKARIRNMLRELNLKRGKKVEISPSIRRTTERFFREDIDRLESLLGYCIPEWCSSKSNVIDKQLH